MNSITKKCMVCGRQLPRAYHGDTCLSCDGNRERESGCFCCRETNCIASSKAHIMGHDVFVDIRMDMEFNQIDAEFGIIYGERDVRAEWSDAFDINYCPVCGRELGITEYNGIRMCCIDNRDYEGCLTLGRSYVVREVTRNGVNFQQVIDDNGKPLQTAILRFL